MTWGAGSRADYPERGKGYIEKDEDGFKFSYINWNRRGVFHHPLGETGNHGDGRVRRALRLSNFSFSVMASGRPTAGTSSGTGGPRTSGYITQLEGHLHQRSGHGHLGEEERYEC